MDGTGHTFYDTAMREAELFTEYVTGGFYARSNLKKNIHRLTDKRNVEVEQEASTTWTKYFGLGGN